MVNNTWTVYLLLNAVKNRTYCGSTTNLARRVRQHNGELKGGAKATRAGKPWHVHCVVEGFADAQSALSFEARLKKQAKGLAKRLELMEKMAKNEGRTCVVPSRVS